jgi:hypothetical protein
MLEEATPLVPWAEILMPAMQRLMQVVSIRDCVALSRVCKSWHAKMWRAATVDLRAAFEQDRTEFELQRQKRPESFWGEAARGDAYDWDADRPRSEPAPEQLRGA